MAEQGLAENGDQAAAAMAAAAIEADIDSMMEQPVRDGSSAEEAQGDASDGTPPAAADGASTFLVIKELRGISRGRSLRLQPEDIVVAIDGMPYHQDIETFLDIIFECDPETGKLLTIWRNGVLFNVIVRGPLGCTLEHAKPEVAEKVTADFARIHCRPPIETYATFEVLRDIFRKCIVIDTRLSPDGDDLSAAVADAEPPVGSADRHLPHLWRHPVGPLGAVRHHLCHSVDLFPQGAPGASAQLCNDARAPYLDRRC